MGDKHHGNTLLPVQPQHSVDDLTPSRRVQHSRGLVQHDALRLHGQNTRNGDALLLPAGEQVRCVAGELLHAHRRQRIVHPPAYLRRRHTQVLRAEGYILLHHIGHDLIVRVLEHHPRPPPYLQQHSLVAGVHPLHIHSAAARQQHRVQVLGKGGLAGAVVAQHHRKATLFDLYRYIPQGRRICLPLRRRVRIGQVPCLYHHCHTQLLPFLFTRKTIFPWRRRAAPCRFPCRAGPARPM